MLQRKKYLPVAATRLERGRCQTINYGFTNQYKDKESELYYYKQRYYNPERNLYSYVRKNSLIYADPNGEAVFAISRGEWRKYITKPPVGNYIYKYFVPILFILTLILFLIAVITICILKQDFSSSVLPILSAGVILVANTSLLIKHFKLIKKVLITESRVYFNEKFIKWRISYQSP